MTALLAYNVEFHQVQEGKEYIYTKPGRALPERECLHWVLWDLWVLWPDKYVLFLEGGHWPFPCLPHGSFSTPPCKSRL